jgi:hypothetical protein
MKTHRVFNVLFRAAFGAVAFAALSAFVAPASADTVLFQDNFSYPYPGASPYDGTSGYTTDLNFNNNYAGRQSGTLVAGGPITYTQAHSTLYLGYSGAQNGASEVIQGAFGACFTPNVDFNGSLSAGGLIISYDAANWGPFDGDAYNIAVGSIGLDHASTDSDPKDLCQWTTSHFSFEFGFGSGFGHISAYGMWNSGSAVAGGGLPVSVYDYALHHVDLVCTDSSGHDNNPFDGAGNTHIEVYVDSTLIGAYTKGSGGYAHNYITLGGYRISNNVQEWDNLTVTQTEVPVSPLNQWAGAALGNWSDGAKWTSGLPAGGQADVARFMALSEADSVVNVTAPVTVGTLLFDNTHSYTIQSSNPSVNTITLDNGAGNAAILVDGGSHTVSAPLVQAGNLDFNLAVDTSLTLSGPVSGGGYDWTIHGPGNLTLTGAATSVNAVNLPYTGSSADNLTVSGSGASLAAATINVGERGIMTVSGGGSVTASNNVDANHILTVTGTGSSLSTPALNVYRPHGYDPSCNVEVADGGTITTPSVSVDTTGAGGSWVILSAGGTMDTTLVYGDGALNFNGGTLVNSAGGSGAKASIDLLALVFTNGGSYSLDPGEILSTSELLGRYDAVEGASDGTFTFNGGSLQCRNDPRGLPNFIGVPGQLLTHVYVDADTTINLNSQELDVYQPLEGSHNLHFSSGSVYFCGDNSSWSGNLEIDPYVVVGIKGNNPNGLGLNSVDIPYTSNLWFLNATESMVVSNPITLNGPGDAADPKNVALAWDPLIETGGPSGYTMTLTGTLTVHNQAGVGAAPNLGIYTGSTLELNGQIADGTGDVGGLTIGNGLNGDYYGGNCRISGPDSNNYRGDTNIESGFVFLNKDSGKTAIPSAHIYIGSGAGETGNASLVIEGSDPVSTQLNTAAVITFNQDNTSEGWAEFSMNGHSQTVGGLDSPETQRDSPANGIDNGFTLGTVLGIDSYPRPATTGTLTVNTVHAADDYTYSGEIFDGLDGDLSLSIVKDGPGTQRFLPGVAGPNGNYAYTGGTTVKAGTLDVSAVGLFTPNSPITLAGGTLIAGNELSGTVTRLDATHSGTLEAGGTAFNTLTLRGAADIGAAVIDADHSLILTAASNVIDRVAGAGSSTLQVTTDAALTSGSIAVGTLTIGGAAPAPAPAPVPEPGTLVLLIAAGLAAGGWLRLRKK